MTCSKTRRKHITSSPLLLYRMPNSHQRSDISTPHNLSKDFTHPAPRAPHLHNRRKTQPPRCNYCTTKKRERHVFTPAYLPPKQRTQKQTRNILHGRESFGGAPPYHQVPPALFQKARKKLTTHSDSTPSHYPGNTQLTQTHLCTYMSRNKNYLCVLPPRLSDVSHSLSAVCYLAGRLLASLFVPKRDISIG